MIDPTEQHDPDGLKPPARLSRRAVLGGLAAAAATPWLLRSAQAAPMPAPGPTPIAPEAPEALAPAFPPLPLARQSHTATAISGTFVLIAGGRDATGNVLADAVVYGTNGSLTAVAPMNTPRYAHAAVLLPYGKVLVLGGTGIAGTLADAEIYDPAHNTWTPAAPLALARTGHTAVHIAGTQILVFGGYSQGVLSDVEVYSAS